MAAGDQQQQVREGHIIGKARGERVALQVIDREEGQVAGERDGLGGHHADDHAADRGPAARGGDAVEIGEAQPGLRQGAGDQPVEMVEMGTRGHFRHDPAIGPVNIDLDRTRSDRRSRPSVTRAAAVSSQLVSIPRTIMAKPVAGLAPLR